MRPHSFLVSPLNPGTFSYPPVTHTPTQQHNRTTQNFKAPPTIIPGREIQAVNSGAKTLPHCGPWVCSNISSPR